MIVAAGGGCSAAWVVHASLPLVWQQAEAFNWWLALPAVVLTCASVSLRFLRWQFLLRRAGVRLPIRQSAGIFTAGLAML
ncbi:MAG TPA: lysylphosphatidylglycerol synthase domain-containing protein, partial [Dehalococcoidia bacterium]